MPRAKLATAAAVVYVLLWASAFVPSRVIATCAPPLWILAARFLVAGALLVPGPTAKSRPGGPLRR